MSASVLLKNGSSLDVHVKNRLIDAYIDWLTGFLKTSDQDRLRRKVKWICCLLSCLKRENLRLKLGDSGQI